MHVYRIRKIQHKVHPKHPKLLPSTPNAEGNKENKESDEVHLKPLKTIGPSPKGTLTLLSFISYYTFHLLLNQLKRPTFFMSVKFTMKKKLNFIGMLTVVRHLNALLQVMSLYISTLNILCNYFSTWN